MRILWCAAIVAVLCAPASSAQSAKRNVRGLAPSCPSTGILDATKKFCCPKTCGKCGGSGCDKRPGGYSACCTGQIKASCAGGKLPCELVSEPDPSKCPANGIADSSGDYCCAKTCGKCGGSGCDKRPGGPSACCTGQITASCAGGKLPCKVTSEPPPSKCPANGITDSSGDYCCPETCGKCGGSGCDKRPGGASACCTGQITASCADGKLPCTLTSEPDPSTCPASGIADSSGDFCCPETCGKCGGSGCDKRPGGPSACCTGQITASCAGGKLPCKVTTAPPPSKCPANGITDSSGDFCCPKTCGKCGGAGCDKRPGGASACCTGQITASCADGKLPCTLTSGCF